MAQFLRLLAHGYPWLRHPASITARARVCMTWETLFAFFFGIEVKGAPFAPSKKESLNLFLKWLQMQGCALITLPSQFCPQKLAVLHLSESKIQQLCSSYSKKVAENLMVMNLRVMSREEKSGQWTDSECYYSSYLELGNQVAHSMSNFGTNLRAAPPDSILRVLEDDCNGLIYSRLMTV
ncbi:hypothetical protein GOBAR_DD04287 [Gossypium barbadense]|nr:hypothetical protein GOBAR_DD04287 [Gossypium barbadense]